MFPYLHFHFNYNFNYFYYSFVFIINICWWLKHKSGHSMSRRVMLLRVGLLSWENIKCKNHSMLLDRLDIIYMRKWVIKIEPKGNNVQCCRSLVDKHMISNWELWSGHVFRWLKVDSTLETIIYQSKIHSILHWTFKCIN